MGGIISFLKRLFSKTPKPKPKPKEPACDVKCQAETKAKKKKKPTPEQVKKLTELFGKNDEGAQKVLDKLNKGERIDLPDDLKPKDLLDYREIAQDAINRSIDKRGTQAIRIQIIDKVLENYF